MKITDKRVVYKNEKAGSEEPAIHGTIRSAPFS